MIASWCAPAQRQLQTFARMPSNLAVMNRESVWALRERGHGTPLSFLEGPVLDGHGGLYLVDVAWGRILHVTADGEFSVVIEYDGEPNGLAWLDDDRLAVADFRRGLLQVEGLTTGRPRVRTLLERADDAPFLGLNDLVVARDGAIWFTDQGQTGLHDPAGRLYRWQQGGTVDVVLDRIPSPNSLVLDEASSTAYIAVTRDNAIWRIPYGRQGVRKVGKYIQLSGGVGPDGLSWGPSGTLLVTQLGMGVVWVYDARGVPVLALQAPEGLATTNICADPNGRLYVTESESSSVLTIDLAAELTSLASTGDGGAR